MFTRTLAAALIGGLLSLPLHAETTDSETPSQAGRVGTVVAASTAASPRQNIDKTEWQRQYDAAQEAVKNGKKKTFIGAGVMVGGIVIATMGSGRGSTGGAFAGNFIALGGGGLAGWGGYEWQRANNKLDQLDLQKTKVVNLIPIGGRQGVGVRLGPTVASVGYQFRW